MPPLVQIATLVHALHPPDRTLAHHEPFAEQLRLRTDALCDRFDQMGAWTVRPSDGVEATGSLDVDAQGDAGSKSLKVDYSFKAGAGYFIIRVPLNITLPANYEVAFSLRSTGKPNNFECKLVDGSINGVKATPEGDDVWWVNTRNMPRASSGPERR
jgi:hypothetical protein